jgi:hypothetical protein
LKKLKGGFVIADVRMSGLTRAGELVAALA